MGKYPSRVVDVMAAIPQTVRQLALVRGVLPLVLAESTGRAQRIHQQHRNRERLRRRGH